MHMSKLKSVLTIFIILLSLTFDSIADKRKKAPQKAELTDAGKQIEKQFEEKLKILRSEITASLPSVDEIRKSAFLKNFAAELIAKEKLDKAQKNKGKVGQAKALVAHAKGKWIGGADKGIAKAKAMLQKAKTDAAKSAAQKELEKWQKNREDGVKALQERQAALEKAQAEESQIVKELKSAENELKEAKANFIAAYNSLNIDSPLSNSDLDAKLVLFVVLNQATPYSLAAFAEKSVYNKSLVDRLLSNPKLMRQMLVADGAKNGKFGEAMKIYETIQSKSSKAKEGVLQKLALAISLEHAEPVKQRNPEAATSAPETIDPVNRYLHYEKAYLNKELDPAFEYLNVWDYRMVVDGEEPDETLAWGREMLRNYRPDHISTSDYRWRYVALVKTDIPYGSEDNKFDKPELQFYQNILMNGGICGRRAFIGRFILRAFGVPTTARPQKGHAALAHWTPNGWVICLGAGWGSGWTKTLYKSDLDFLASTQSRSNSEAYLKVKRAQWIAEVAGEKRVYGFNSGKPEFWNNVSLNIQRSIIENAGTVTLAAVGTDIGEATESKVKEKVQKVSVQKADKEITVGNDGVIKIPATACSKPTNSTRKIKFMPSSLGGMQLHYEQNGGNQDFEYTVEAPESGKYALTARVATPTWKQFLVLSVNGAKDSVNVELPHTVGLWDTSKPVQITLKKGKNILSFSRGTAVPEEGKRIKGVSIKDFTLTPVK